MDCHQLLRLFSICLLAVGFCHGQIVSPESLNGSLGGSVTFTPSFNTPVPTIITIVWRVNGSHIVTYAGGPTRPEPGYEQRTVLNTSTGSLLLRNLVQNDQGKYSMTIVTQNLTLTWEAQLNVFEAVSNVKITPDRTDLVEYNSSVTLSCSSSGSSPFSYRWLNGSSEVTAGDGVLVDATGHMTITSVTRYDRGPYWCLVSNPVSNNVSSEPLTLIIRFGPEMVTVEVIPVEDLYGSGSDLTLYCTAVSDPPAQFQWALNGTMLSNKGPELSLKNIQASQSGSYICWAHNAITLRYKTSEPANITVIQTIINAEIKISPNTPTIEGSSITLTCDAFGSNITREWKKDDLYLLAVGNISISDDKKTVSIKHVKKSDEGKYLCNLVNPVSSAAVEYTLTVHPDGYVEPGGLSAGAIAGIVIAVLVVVLSIIGLVIYISKRKCNFMTKSSGGMSVGNTGTISDVNVVPADDKELNYAYVSHFQKADQSVQLGNQNTPSTVYAQVRVNGSAQPVQPPTHEDQFPAYSKVKKPAPKPAPNAASTNHSDVRRS
ncbi:hypothetical protein DPEC_G00144420 [Dallia pectoralis]|uniref:Uncharacterized protein n=1 Tax=Dallia pectoralis TaxID=75939 RepID=A0ACC2GP60_DALPE|nr:hypothetical protein DPEC_G00144420 [Dallia pectoralis]